MPNAILRAGPFASTSSSFLNEPTSVPTTFDGATLPINCANYSGSSNWSWRYLMISDVGSTSAYFTTSKDETQISKSFTNASIFEGETLAFAYQAAVDFTFSGTYAVNAGFEQGVSSRFEIRNRADQSLFDSGAGTTSVSGSFSITLPAKTVPDAIFLFPTGEGNGINATINVNLIAET